MSLTKVTYAMIKDQWQVNVRDFIPPGTDVATTDCTEYIQAAIDSMSSYAGGLLIVPPGEYLFTNLTIDYPLAIVGQTPGVCRFFTNEVDGGIEITTARGVLLQNMGFFGNDDHTGSLVKVVSDGVAYNSGTRIQNCEFYNFFNGLDFQDAGQMLISDSTFITYRGSAVFIQNTTTPDAGDGEINSCIFSASSDVAGVAIYQVSAGGLKVTNNKFLSGLNHYLLDVADGVFTSILVFDGNSSEFASNENMYFRIPNAGNFPYVVISNNQFSVSANAIGLDFDLDTPSDMFNVLVEGNSLNGSSAWTGMQFKNVSLLNIGTNNYNTTGTLNGTGVSFLTGNSNVTLHRQAFANVSVPFLNLQNVSALFNYHQPIAYGSGNSLSVTITGTATNMLAQGDLTDARLILIADSTSGGMAIGVLTSVGWSTISSTLSSITLAVSGGYLTGQTTGGASSRILYMVVLNTGYAASVQ